MYLLGKGDMTASVSLSLSAGHCHNLLPFHHVSPVRLATKNRVMFRMNDQQPVEQMLLDAVPILPSLNFSETRDFYVDALGFDEVGFNGLDYFVVRRGGIELHFWLSDDPLQCHNSSVLFRAEAPSELYREFCDGGIEAIRPLEDSKACAQTVRFHIRDPHGNLLLFGAVI